MDEKELRDRAAVAALQGLVMSGNVSNPEVAAQLAVSLADALVMELRKGGGTFYQKNALKD